MEDRNDSKQVKRKMFELMERRRLRIAAEIGEQRGEKQPDAGTGRPQLTPLSRQRRLSAACHGRAWPGLS